MVKKRKRKGNRIFKALGFLALHLLKLPWYLYKGIRYITHKGEVAVKKARTRKKRSSMPVRFEDFIVLQKDSGDYADWRKTVFTSDSKIGIILGARGTGKTAIGVKLLENFHTKTRRKCFAMGFSESELPTWIRGVDDISLIENDSFVLIDEGGILFSSRKSMSSANTILSNLILIARHKNISILFISQNSSNLEINVLRQADFLLLKPSSLLQKDFERKIIKEIYKQTSEGFRTHKEHKGLTYIYSDQFRGFVENALPTFWQEGISKSFR